MSLVDDYSKVLDSSLSLALAPGFMKSAFESLEEIEYLLDAAASERSAEDDADVTREFARSGFLLLAVAQLEDLLNETCNDLSLYRPTTLRVTDLSGSDFDRAQKYIQKVLQSDIPDNASWSTLKDYRVARTQSLTGVGLRFPLVNLKSGVKLNGSRALAQHRPTFLY